MKKLKFIVLFALAAAFVGCSSDDDNGGSNKYTQENLIGEYKMESYEATEIKKVQLDPDFDPIKTTTTYKGQTFNLDYIFKSNNKVVLDGNFLMKEKKKQGNTTNEDEYIINYNNEERSYSVNQGDKTLTIDGRVYDVKGFNKNGFEIRHESFEDDENGTTEEFSEKIKFSKVTE